MTTIYVGNLSFKASEEALTSLFSEYGDVASAKIITDRETGRSRGFAFVEMNDDQQADEAIEDLHDREFLDRALVVNRARPKRESNGFGGSRPRGPRNRY